MGGAGPPHIEDENNGTKTLDNLFFTNGVYLFPSPRDVRAEGQGVEYATNVRLGVRGGMRGGVLMNEIGYALAALLGAIAAALMVSGVRADSKQCESDRIRAARVAACNMCAGTGSVRYVWTATCDSTACAPTYLNAWASCPSCSGGKRPHLNARKRSSIADKHKKRVIEVTE
jgi:hypothetical protein